ncbi:PAS domain S-box-containing protein [Larkinella arboricola]|uniref:histidine kinase n=1 Tax=Larkinella arboricola TaxID=643671 RepID=A0A327X1Y8_LARAB|nr:PAS domain S-box protein [Larkinella arboricola]RAK00212.1 PAS domain S-box-containing protein [Larkinella arboricola]
MAKPELQTDTLLSMYRTAFETMSQGFCILEKVPTPADTPSDFRYLLTNPAFEQQFELRGIVGKTIRQVISEVEERIVAYFDQVALTGQPIQFQGYVASLDTWMDAQVVRLEGYELPRIAVRFDNITERKKAEETLQLNHLWLTLAMRSAGAGWGSWDLVTGNIEWSAEAKEIIGLTASEEAHTVESWLSRVHPEDRPKVEAEADEMVTQRKEFDCEYRVVHDDGQVRWLRGTGRLLYDKTGAAYRSTGLVMDITERRQIDQALRQSEEKYRLLFRSIGEGFCLIKLRFDDQGQAVDYRFLDMNHSFEKLTGIYNGVGRWMRDIEPRIEQHWFDIYGEVARTGQDRRFEAQAEALGRWYDVYAFRVGSPREHTVGLLFNDITQRKRQQAHQALLTDISEAIMNLADSDTILNVVGEKLTAFFPISSFSVWNIRPEDDDVYRRFWWSKDALPFLEKANLAAFLNQDSIRHLRRGEDFVITDTQTDPRANAEAFKALNIGSYVGLPYRREVSWSSMLAIFSPVAYDWRPDQIALLTDVMNRLLPRIERAQAEEALKASEARLTAVFESLPVGVGVVDNTGKFILSNRELHRFIPTGIMPSRDADRQDRWQAYHPDGRRLEPEEYPGARALRGERVVPGIEMLYTPDEGPPIWTRVAAVPIWDGEGRLNGQVGIITDISELKQAEEALKEASRRKDEFLAMLAHELRNPLASIRLGMGLLSWTDETDPVLEQTVGLINQQVDHLVRLVDELLDVSRISRGKIELKPERVELGALVKSAVEAIRPQYEALDKPLHLTPCPLPLFVQGDPTRLAQVVTNLLTNGLRYTGLHGQVWISLRAKGQEAVLRVADNGIGLAPDQLTAIFELFVQVDVSLARSQGGLGIGLTLVKRLVEMHGGRVEARSPGLGQGSEFVVYLPLLEKPQQNRDAATATTASKPSRHRILVIDDNPGLAFMLSQTLKMRGYEVHTQHSGREGIKAAEELRPTVILCDIGMPELDGYETCQLIRQQPWGQDVLIIAVTGYGQEDDKRRAKEAGFNEHLLKPVDMGALIRLLEE